MGEIAGMGEIVAAMVSCHAPQLFTYPTDEDPVLLDSSIAAMQELGTLLDETKPDVLIVLGSDHLETFPLSCVPTFAVLAGNRAVATFAGRTFDIPIHRDFAEALLGGLVTADFDVAYSEDAILGHAFAVPFAFILGDRKIPVVPFHTNVYMPPLASPQRCAALGRQIANIVKSRPERVAILASGGMSHFPGTRKYSEPEFDFDAWMIAELERGNMDALLEMSTEQLDEVGNTELLNWSVLFGAIGSSPGRLLRYTKTWHHGHAMMQFVPPVPQLERADVSKKVDAPAFGGFEFQNHGFEFYKHPPSSAYNLNRLLHDIRVNADLCQRLIDDLDGIVAEYRLTDKEAQGIRIIPTVAYAERVSDCAPPLVAAGAHPLQALMSLHAVHGAFRKQASG